ncbi:SLC13 family permease [Arsenicicoccus bolidensis]|uniref:SLC13 family permease n=1 Tax=Arsenicicoccus bolidensis TaxID=229480 RepID=UPI0028A9E918|nr:SLC13 family permease [Arsenicicoccus bolidensis]
MSPEWVSILALVALFAIGTLLPINMGALAFVAAWLVGMFSLDLKEKEILGGMSGDLVLTLVGVTYLFAIAKNNGTVDLIIRSAVRMVGGRIVLIPWVMFGVTALLTAIGAASPAACAIVGPIALGFAGRHKINPLLMGMFVVHGAQAGGFSPISIYGTITNAVMRDNDLPSSEVAVFLISFVVNLLICVALWLVLGRSTRSRANEPDDYEVGSVADVSSPSPGGATGVDTSVHHDTMTATRTTGAQVITLLMFVAVAGLSLFFDKNIGFTAITGAVLLTAIFPKAQKGAISQVAWSTVLLVAGVSTFAAILEKAGAPEYVGTWAAGFSTAVIGALVLCYVGGVVSAFASSTALLPIIIPISIPLIRTGDVSPIAIAAALGVASTIVDVSPYSTNGALMVANRPEGVSEEAFYKKVLAYAALVTLVGPLLVWLAVVVPGWL